MLMEDNCLTYQFDSFELDLSAFRLTRDGVPLELEPKALQLLAFLLQNQGRLLKKQELLEAVWGEVAVTENALTREIALVRRVLGDSTRDSKYIETVPTQGYRFIASVREVHKEEAPPAASFTSLVEHPQVEVRRAKFRPLEEILVVLLVVIAVVAVVLLLALHRTSTVASGDSPSTPQLIQATTSDGLDAFPSFSPDGKSIAYSSEKSGAYEIYLRQLESSGGEIQLTQDGAGNIEPAWSSDGQWIAYHSMTKGGIWILPAFGGAPRRITDFGSRPAWSHNGAAIAFESGAMGTMAETEFGASPDSTIWVVKVSDGSLQHLTQTAAPPSALATPPWFHFGDSSPQWSRDDRRVLYASSGKLWTVSADGKDIQQLVSGPTAYDPVYSGDGRRIYFLRQDASGSGIWEMPINDAGSAAGPSKQIYSSALGVIHYLAATGTGSRLAFSLVNTQDNLYSIKTPASGAEAAPVPLTRDTRSRKTIPAFSPDGSLVAFAALQRGSVYQIWIASADGKSARKIPIEVPVMFPYWFGQNVLGYWTQDSGNTWRLWRWELASATPVNVFSTHESVGGAQLSPDAKSIVFTKVEHGALNIWKMTFEDSRATQLTFDKNMAGWATW